MAGLPAMTKSCARSRVKPGDDVVRPDRRPTSVETEVGDVLRSRLQLTLFDPKDDVGHDRIGRRRDTDLLALSDDIAIEERDLGAAALDHILARRGAMLAAAAIGHREAMLVDFLLRRRIALAGARQGLGVHVANLIEGVAERLADADRFTAEPVREMPERIVLDDLAADQPGARGKAVPHHIGDQLRPALAPDILGDEGAVRVGEQAADLLGAVGDAAMHLADPEDRVL